MADKGAETEQFIHRRLQKKTKWQEICEFIWDPHEKKFLSRTWCSWLEITIFYVIFYSCLVAFWAVCLAVFVYTLDDKVPRYYGKGTIIGINPGMGYQPWLLDDPESTLIYINKNDEKTWTRYVNQLNKYLEKGYSNKTNTRKCVSESETNKQTDEFPCQFNFEDYFPAACKNETSFGYPEGKPCVILALNRLIDWTPLAYPDDSPPAVVADRYESGDIAIDCRGENPADREHIHILNYYPESGLQAKYFPYRFVPNYQQPIAMVQFENVEKGVLIQVECLAYAYNIIHDAEDRQGLIHFELLLDNFD